MSGVRTRNQSRAVEIDMKGIEMDIIRYMHDQGVADKNVFRLFQIGATGFWMTFQGELYEQRESKDYRNINPESRTIDATVNPKRKSP